METEQIGQGVYLSKMRESGPKTYFPASYSLDRDNDFSPFEYTIANCPPPHPALLFDVRAFLYQYSLRDLLAISSLAYDSGPSIETLLYDPPGCVTRRVEKETYLFEPNCVITAWAFSQTDGQVRPAAIKRCTKTEGRGHKPSWKWACLMIWGSVKSRCSPLRAIF